MFFVRTASERDLAKVSALLAETWPVMADAIYGPDKAAAIAAKHHSVAALKADLQRKSAEFVVADDGRAIGGMGYAVMSETHKKGAVLRALFVSPQHQRQGIGRDLFAELETCFPDAEFMQSEVELRNSSAISFLEAHGFVKIGETENCGDAQSGVPGILMEKPLGG